MEIAGLVIAAVAGLGIMVIGVTYLARPQAAASGFGLPVLPHEGATSWLVLKGVRDTVSGVVAGVLILTAPITVLGWCLAAFALIPLGDAVVVHRAGGSPAAAWGIHGATAGLMVVGAGLLLLA